ncbi:MAG: glycoside hydrolase family 15 protein [Candidatus Dormibacteraeota bacterium]|nr:glycoside hydrolase family 15 protein [Candidatus Dormibacteraeota bacterium]
MQHPIGDHALLADGRTAALVDPDGNVAWLCWPRIDSVPCLLSILDDVSGGVFTVAPADPRARVVERAYIDGTLILRTVWRAHGGELVVHDWLACDAEPRLVRSLHASGTVEVVARARLAPDAARAGAEVATDGAVLRVGGGGIEVSIHAPATWQVDGDGVATCRFRVDTTGCAVVLGDRGMREPSTSIDATTEWFASRVGAAAAPSALAERTLGTDAARALIRHSAAVLAGLRQRGGGIVAAPTTSLPQWPGSSRTWDYRYSWLRDTALAGLAMLRCGLHSDAAGLGDFIGAATSSLPPAVLLRVDGTAPPEEQALDHLRGYGGARPVRIGNAASQQPQLDVAGEVLELAAALAAHDLLPTSLRNGVVRVADWTSDHWTQPDHGIWEIRGAPRHYTHSRVMAWSGLVRAAALAERGVVAGDAARWRQAAQDVRDSVMGGVGALALTDTGGGPDAALAQVATVGLLNAGDARLGATLDSITGALDRGGLVDRHLPTQDTSDEPCGPFLFATFWLAEALERGKRDGSMYFTAAVAARGPLDLFGEVADPADMSPLGNYPQVQSHASFVLAATQALPAD